MILDISSLPGMSGAYLSEMKVKMDQEQQNAASFETALTRAAANGDDKELLTACKEFETYFLNSMFKEMRKTTFGEKKSAAEQTFTEMLDTEYAGLAADKGGAGLAAFLYKQMKRNHVQ
jgi:flagellar protein FlgJ